jgi:lipid II:glycine glycyltransferase (peptidoglycan interpeptide bridge formation enzyme)
VIDLGPGEKALYEGFDAAVRRAIRKAEGEALQVEFGSNLDSMRTYYALHRSTRRRHGLAFDAVKEALE